MFNLRVKDEARLYGALKGLAQGFSNFTRRWGRNKEIRLRHQRDWMDTRGRGTWEKLTDTYLERKSHNPKAAFLEILQLTGHLYRSLTEERAADSVIEEGRSRLVMGTSDPKAIIHHEGRGRVPVRRVIDISAEETREHKEALYESITEVVLREGFVIAR
jgi:hypothetical protein